MNAIDPQTVRDETAHVRKATREALEEMANLTDVEPLPNPTAWVVKGLSRPRLLAEHRDYISLEIPAVMANLSIASVRIDDKPTDAERWRAVLFVTHKRAEIAHDLAMAGVLEFTHARQRERIKLLLIRMVGSAIVLMVLMTLLGAFLNGVLTAFWAVAAALALLGSAGTLGALLGDRARAIQGRVGDIGLAVVEAEQQTAIASDRRRLLLEALKKSARRTNQSSSATSSAIDGN